MFHNILIIADGRKNNLPHHFHRLSLAYTTLRNSNVWRVTSGTTCVKNSALIRSNVEKRKMKES